MIAQVVKLNLVACRAKKPKREIIEVNSEPVRKDMILEELPIFSLSRNPYLREFCIERNESFHLSSLNQPVFLPSVIMGLKNSHIYNAHTYHTKVPPEVIEQFILEFTGPNDLVLDMFSGSGMTGVAALRHGRRVILIDLSPIATFLSYNHCVPVDAIEFKRALNRVTEAVIAEVRELYTTVCRKCLSMATIEKTIWSEVVLCPSCSSEIILWDVALGKDLRVRKGFSCPCCKVRLQRGDGRRVSWIPVRVSVKCHRCGRYDAEPNDADFRHLANIESQEIPDNLWYPRNKVRWGDMWRRGYHEGINTVADFYTKRNLRALAVLYKRILEEEDIRIRSKLLFVFTNVIWHGSRMRRFNAYGGARPMNAALYIPAIMEEVNVLSVFRHKSDVITRMTWEIRQHDPQMIRVSTQSALDLSNIPDESVDYIFTDPPYGGNILYSEVNFLWESWLGHFTNPSDEIVISKYQEKSISEYRDLLTRSFQEAFRVLKQGRWMTLTFNTSNREVWDALQDALWEAGFDVWSVQILDKGHRSFKQLTSTNIAGYDVLVTSRKSNRSTRRKSILEIGKKDGCAVLDTILTETTERDPQRVYAEFVAYFLRKGQRVPFSYKQFLRWFEAKMLGEGKEKYGK